jgi:hypothetical protein
LIVTYAPSKLTDTDADRPFSREKDFALSEFTHTQPKLIVCGRGEEESEEGLVWDRRS